MLTQRVDWVELGGLYILYGVCAQPPLRASQVMMTQPPAPPAAAQPLLAEMPDLVLLEIAKYLGPEETTRLSMTCRRLYDILPKFLVMKGEDFSIVGTGTGYGDVELYFDGPLLQWPVKSLSVGVVGWRDQGWGNRKGELYVKLMRRSVVAVPCLCGTRKESVVVAERRELFGLAEHMESSARVDLNAREGVVSQARPGDWYQFMRRGGGGGGHRLHVRGFKAVASYYLN